MRFRLFYFEGNEITVCNANLILLTQDGIGPLGMRSFHYLFKKLGRTFFFQRFIIRFRWREFVKKMTLSVYLKEAKKKKCVEWNNHEVELFFGFSQLNGELQSSLLIDRNTIFVVQPLLKNIVEKVHLFCIFFYSLSLNKYEAYYGLCLLWLYVNLVYLSISLNIYQ